MVNGPKPLCEQCQREPVHENLSGKDCALCERCCLMQILALVESDEDPWADEEDQPWLQTETDGTSAQLSIPTFAYFCNRCGQAFDDDAIRDCPDCCVKLVLDIQVVLRHLDRWSQFAATVLSIPNSKSVA